MIKVVAFPHQRIFKDLNDNNKYYEILCKKKGYFYYINKDSIFEITGDPCYLIGSHGYDEHHRMK